MAIQYKEKALPSPQKIGFSIDTFSGININGTASKGEFVNCKNLSGDRYPYASPRASKEVIADGIVAPKRLFFAGDNMAYIANGQLYVNTGEEFESKGVVGEVKSIVDFNNADVLFYPSNSKYSIKDGTLSDVTEYFETGLLETGRYDNRYFADYYDIENAPKKKDIEGHAIYLKVNGSRVLNLPPLENEDGTPKLDDDGNPLYGSVTFNATEIPEKLIANGVYKNDRLYLNLIVYPLKNTGASAGKAKLCNFGEEISFPYASMIMADIVIFHYGMIPPDYSKCKKEVNALLNNKDFKVWLTASTYPAPNSRPHIDYACMDNNRVVAVHKNSFYASSLGDYTKWTDFVDAEGNPKATGSYAEELNTPGDFNSITKYNTSVILTKNDIVYVCYGNKPPYRINEVCKTGCIDGRTIAEVDSYLYWLGRDGIYRFGGGSPRLISHKIGGDFVSGVAVANGLKYYCCLYDGKSYKMYVYNAQYDFWHIEDSVQYVDLVAKDGIVYGLTADGEIVKFDSGDERVSWSFTTIDFDFSTEYTKNVAKVYCRLKLYDQAYVNLYIRSNKQDWYKFASYKADGTNVFQAKAKLKKCDYFTLRVEGVGDAEIMDIYADCLLGSQKHRSSGLSQFRKG